MRSLCIDPRTDPLWQALLDQGSSSVFHSPAWLQVLADTYDFDVRAHVLIGDDETPQAGLPFVRVRDHKGERIVALPFSDYCDPLFADALSEGDASQNSFSKDGAWRRLAQLLLEERRPIKLRLLHAPFEKDGAFEIVNRAKWHGLDLQPDLDTLWNNLHGSARRAVRKAQKENVTVHAAQSAAELRAFFVMHLKVRKYKYRLLAQPYRFFEAIWHHFIEKHRGTLLLVRHEKTIIGGTLFLEWQNGLYYKFNASTLSQLSFRPNDLLLWEGIKYGKAAGFTHLDLGLSDWEQEGLVSYKRKFTDEEKTISFLSRSPDAALPELAQQEVTQPQLLPRLTDLFTHHAVPDAMTEKAGNALYRFFT